MAVTAPAKGTTPPPGSTAETKLGKAPEVLTPTFTEKGGHPMCLQHPQEHKICLHATPSGPSFGDGPWQDGKESLLLRRQGQAGQK